VKLVDANVLLYAVNEADPKHTAARRWLDAALNGTETVGFAWAALLAFLRLSTRAGLFPRPLSVDEACDRVDAWTSQPPSVVLDPTPHHLAILTDLLENIGAGGNLVGDAHLAALAIEHGATIVSYDADFGRFGGVVHEQPA
jgi:toxin-antitoxin system PIN domain toxin